MGNSIVVIAEHAESQIRPVTYEIISFAKKLQRSTHSIPVKVLLLADEVKNPAHELADKSGLDVTAVQIPEMTGYNGELYLRVLTEFLPDMQPAFVCIAHTSQGLDYAPALAVNLNAACITGVVNFFHHAGEVSFSKPMYGGKITARLQPAAQTSILTIQPGVFRADGNARSTDGSITVLSISTRSRRSRSLGIKQTDTDTAGISEANVIVAAGMGIGEKENLDCIHQLAAMFTKSAVAGSRIVCDMGWLGYQCQVGVTGATVSPQLYIACGISGAMQHLTGMQSSEFIVAINKDPSAAIFHTADICIVEDLTAFIPAFI
ncbi:MAG: electron transfer flavoprotein subunit alpha/FixB family protein, partial [Deltaproteobacteria bacterium]|nr:electron transfer flavoprotein subunit alpha/FixB family protein [Deltaproteobacteria bacterium]